MAKKKGKKGRSKPTTGDKTLPEELERVQVRTDELLAAVNEYLKDINRRTDRFKEGGAEHRQIRGVHGARLLTHSRDAMRTCQNNLDDAIAAVPDMTMRSDLMTAREHLGESSRVLNDLRQSIAVRHINPDIEPLQTFDIFSHRALSFLEDAAGDLRGLSARWVAMPDPWFSPPTPDEVEEESRNPTSIKQIQKEIVAHVRKKLEFQRSRTSTPEAIVHAIQQKHPGLEERVIRDAIDDLAQAGTLCCVARERGRIWWGLVAKKKKARPNSKK